MRIELWNILRDGIGTLYRQWDHKDQDHIHQDCVHHVEVDVKDASNCRWK